MSEQFPVRLLDPATSRDETGLATVEYRDGGAFFANFEPRSSATTAQRLDNGGIGKLDNSAHPFPASAGKGDAPALWLLPGLLDIHVHFREPGGEASETIATGLAAARAGGFATVVTMPNTNPPVDTPDGVRFQRDGSSGFPRILPSACCTIGRAGRAVAPLAALREAGAVAFTDDGAMVADDAVMEEVMREAARLGVVVMDHAVVPTIARDGVVRDGPAARAHALPLFPDEAEVAAVERDLRLAEKVGAHIHLQHLSCRGSVEAVRRAKARAVRVTCEATPHHLLLASEDIPGNDANWKMNPPLGTRADVAALREAVLDGTIDCFATDHAPHAAALKAPGFIGGAFGVVGLETAVGATLQAMVIESGMAPLDWAARWTTAPARVLGFDPPRLMPGAPVCLVRPGPWVPQDSDLRSKSRNSPMLGRTLWGKPILEETILA